MPKFDCAYCGTSLTHDSLSVRNKHFNGRVHSQNVTAYWRVLAKEEGLIPQDVHRSLVPRPGVRPVDPLNQSSEITAAMPVLGLSTAEKGQIPPPVNIPSSEFPRAYIG